MSSFDFLWQLICNHGGVAENYKAELARVWSSYTLEQQRAIYRSIRDKLQAGKFVNYNPVKAVRENAPKPPRYKILSYADYYEIYHTDLEQDGWKRIHQPEKQTTIFVKQV